VLLNGCFDLHHLGHLQVEKKAVETAYAYNCDLLLWVDSDEAVAARKGPGRPVEPRARRLENAIAGVAQLIRLHRGDRLAFAALPAICVLPVGWTQGSDAMSPMDAALAISEFLGVPLDDFAQLDNPPWCFVVRGQPSNIAEEVWCSDTEVYMKRWLNGAVVYAKTAIDADGHRISTSRILSRAEPV
jgi:cytidyltransferase-like protein